MLAALLFLGEAPSLLRFLCYNRCDYLEGRAKDGPKTMDIIDRLLAFHRRSCFFRFCSLWIAVTDEQEKTEGKKGTFLASLALWHWDFPPDPFFRDAVRGKS